MSYPTEMWLVIERNKQKKRIKLARKMRHQRPKVSASRQVLRALSSIEATT